jgi:hypothetical protein
MGQDRPGGLRLLPLPPSLWPPAAYLGYGGTGKQVRDLLHVEDLLDCPAPPSSSERAPRSTDGSKTVGPRPAERVSVMRARLLIRPVTAIARHARRTRPNVESSRACRARITPRSGRSRRASRPCPRNGSRFVCVDHSNLGQRDDEPSARFEKLLLPLDELVEKVPRQDEVVVRVHRP